MRCAYCQSQKTKVIDSRAVDEGAAIRRRRSCPSCGSRFTTFERRERVDVMVVKKEGQLEPYDRQKIATGFYKALSKRNVSDSLIESNIDEIEDELKRRPEKEVAASEIGDMVMERLKRIDEIAYLRFASVYKRFGDVSEFQRELGELMPERLEDRSR
jgi:transcriptional repressor NrdR